MQRLLLILSLTIFLACVLACGSGPREPGRGTTEPGSQPLASQELQAGRKQYIEKLIREGIFQKVDFSADEIWVAPRFYVADFDAKSTFVSSVVAYRFSVPKGGKLRATEIMHLFDSKTGKAIGYYDDHGLTLE
jgi:hypothetical protein